GGGESASGPAAPSAPRAGASGALGAPTRPRVVHVRDVARVLDTNWERRSAYHYVKHDPGTAGEIVPSIEVSVIQDPGASSAQVVPLLMDAIQHLERENPGIKFETAYDNARFVDILF